MNETARDARLYAAATRRNRDPILKVLARFFPARGSVLEVASGTGEHAAYFARHLPGLTWQPSDPDPEMRRSIEAWVRHTDTSASSAPRPPLALDGAAETWPVERADAIVCINMIHIAPWRCCLGLMAGAGRILPPGGMLYLYGPYKINGRHTADSNAAFDESLRRQNPEWGVRDLDAVAHAAAAQGLKFRQSVEMPANNMSVLFVRDGASAQTTKIENGGEKNGAA